MLLKKIFLLGAMGILAITISISIINRTYASKEEKILKYETHIVKAGETLWEIAKTYRPNEDPRKVVYEIRKHNNISPIIRVGQMIEIPMK